MQKFALSFVFCVLLARAFAPSPTPTPDRCEFGVSAAKEAASAVSNLAVQLYQKIVSSKPQDNLIFSPVSISLALALIEAGADGETRQQIQTLLQAPGSNRLDPSVLYQSLQRQLQVKSDNAKLEIANGLFYSDQGLNLKQDYLNQMKKCFETEVTKAPFSSNPNAARQQINDWVANKTADKIRNLFPQGSIDQNTLAVLANAIYMKAAWADRFKSSDNLPFYVSGNQAKTVRFMVQQEKYSYKSSSDADVVGIRYDQVPLTMYIILPKQRNGIQALEQSLTGDKLKQLYQGAQGNVQEVLLKLPKFTITLSTNLKAILQQLGVTNAFTNAADFSRMAAEQVKVSDAIHEAYIKVNENGTEAAAVTAFKIVPLSAQVPAEPVPFVADHPFIFAIVHNPTAATLFLGKVNSPEEQ